MRGETHANGRHLQLGCLRASQGKLNLSRLHSHPSESPLPLVMLKRTKVLKGKAENLAKWSCCLGRVGRRFQVTAGISGENQGLASREGEKFKRNQPQPLGAGAYLWRPSQKAVPSVLQSVAPGTPLYWLQHLNC